MRQLAGTLIANLFEQTRRGSDLLKRLSSAEEKRLFFSFPTETTLEISHYFQYSLLSMAIIDYYLAMSWV
jgi:hypothetical protein